MNPDDDMEAILSLVNGTGPQPHAHFTAGEIWKGYAPDDNLIDPSIYAGPNWKMTDRFKEYAIFQSINGYRWHLVNLDTGYLYGRWTAHAAARHGMRSVILSEKGVDIIDAISKMEGSGGPKPKKKPQRSYAQMVRDLGDHIPGFYDTVWCPACCRSDTIYTLVQHVNDEHRWTREKIADWLEEIDADTTVHQDKVEHTRIDWTETGSPPSVAEPPPDLIAMDVPQISWVDEHANLKKEIEALVEDTEMPKHYFVTDEGKISKTAPKVDYTMTPEVAEQLAALNKALEPVKEAWSEIQTAMQQLVAEFKKIDMSAFTLTPDAITEEDEDEHEDH